MAASSFAFDSQTLPLFLFAPTAPALPSLALILVAAALALLWFRPGGLAWALSRSSGRPIPGPPGMLLALSGPAPHRALAALAGTLKATDLMAFSVGLTRFVVSTRPDTARMILNGPAFTDRPVKESARELLFHRAMGFAPAGEYWRGLRRIAALHMFSPRRIAASGGHRSAISRQMAGALRKAMGEKGAVEPRKVLQFGALGSVMMSVFGKRLEFGDEERLEWEELVKEGYAVLGEFNWGDHFPLFRWVDAQGIRKRSRRLAARVNVLVGSIIEEHRRTRRRLVDNGDGDFVDVLLDLDKEKKLSDADMLAVLWEMIFRGTDTVAILLEWVMARMVLHQDKQSKAQSDLDAVVGRSRFAADADIPSLPYLQAIVKETLRLHPPGPLLSWARLAVHDVLVGEHFVPAGTTAMVNMWAISRDGRNWANPGEFEPERFMTGAEEVSVAGSDLRLAPFGSGKRVCPGRSLGLATVHLWLAQLLQEFRWVPAERGVDLSECLKMSMELKKPLVCRVIPRG